MKKKRELSEKEKEKKKEYGRNRHKIFFIF